MYSRSIISGKGPSNRVSFKSGGMLSREEILREMRILKRQNLGGSISELDRIVMALGDALPKIVIDIQDAISQTYSDAIAP